MKKYILILILIIIANKSYAQDDSIRSYMDGSTKIILKHIENDLINVYTFSYIIDFKDVFKIDNKYTNVSIILLDKDGFPFKDKIFISSVGNNFTGKLKGIFRVVLSENEKIFGVELNYSHPAV